MMGREYHQTIALFSIFLLILSFFTSGWAAESKNVRQKRNIICYLGLTGFISGMFSEALKGMHKYDPVSIGSLLNGRLHNGVFEGLSTLRNDTKVNVDCEDEIVTLGTLLDVTRASISYEWKQRVLMTLAGSIWTKVKVIQFDLGLTLNMTQGIKLEVTNLKLTRLDGMEFGFSGLGPLNPVIKILGNLVLHIWDQKITQEIEELLRNTLESELGKFKVTF